MIVDMKKSIDSSFRKPMTSVKLSLDEVQIKKNMMSTLGVERAIVGGLYGRAVKASSQTMVNAIRNEYGPRQRALP